MEIQPLLENLSHPDESERLFAADDLGTANDPGAVGPLAARLSVESSRAVREMIVLALRKIESDAVLDHAVRLLSSEDPFIRNEMAALLQAKGETAVPWLATAGKHPDPDVRKLALEAASQIPGSHTKTFLDAALADPDLNVAIAAVESIGATANKNFRKPIEDIVRNAESPMLVIAGIEALANIGDAGSLEILIEKFGEQGEMLFSVISAVGSLGDSGHLAYLETHSENSSLRHEIINALLNLQRREKFTELTPSWLSRIEAWVQSDTSPEFRQDCITLLEGFKNQPAALRLARQLATPS